MTQQEEAMALVVDEENVVDAEELPTQQVTSDVSDAKYIFLLCHGLILYEDKFVTRTTSIS